MDLLLLVREQTAREARIKSPTLLSARKKVVETQENNRSGAMKTNTRAPSLAEKRRRETLIEESQASVLIARPPKQRGACCCMALLSVLLILLLSLKYELAESAKLPDIYWNSSNPM